MTYESNFHNLRTGGFMVYHSCDWWWLKVI